LIFFFALSLNQKIKEELKHVKFFAS